MKVPHPIPPDLAVLIAERFKVLSDPTRIRLLDELRDGAASVGELTDATGASQQNVSKHLGVLHGAGLVARSRDGNFTRYSIADPSVYELCELVCGGIGRRLDAIELTLKGGSR